MATQSMAYDDPVYRARVYVNGFNAAGASALYGRFTLVSAMLAKSMQVTVGTAGTGTGNATVSLARIATGGTAITTLGSVVMGTSSAGVSTNITLGNTSLTAGDQLYFINGADAAGVFVVQAELVLVPGANVTV